MSIINMNLITGGGEQNMRTGKLEHLKNTIVQVHKQGFI